MVKDNPPVLKIMWVSITLLLLVALPQFTTAYPPAVGILSQARNCLTCHPSDGPWKNATDTIIDVQDKSSGKSLRQSDGTFVISAKRGEPKTVLTIIG